MIEQVGDYLAWLGGADKNVLDQVPSERMKFVQMAGVLLTTSSIAVLSMTFALHDGLKIVWPAAAVVGLFWGFVILNLDRFLVLSMGAARGLKQLLLMASPRLAMAMVLAVVISTPLVLRIFASDINARVYEIQLERSKTQAGLEANSKEQLEVNHLLAQINADQSILDGNLPASVTSPQLQAAQQKVTALQGREATAQKAMNAAYKAWVCELYGHRCDGASGVPGNGNLAQIKHQEYLQAKASADAIKSQLNAAVSAEQAAQNNVSKAKSADLAQAQQRARDELPGLRHQYSGLVALLHAEAQRGTRLNDGDTGILAQIQALYSIGDHDAALELAHLAVFLLFFLIELLPVMVKVLLSLGPVTAYETVAKLKEDELIDRARTRRTEARRVEEGKSRTRINVEDDMRAKEEVLGKRANDHVAAEMTTILDIALQEWSARVRSQLASGAASTAGSGTGGSGTGGSGTGGQAGGGMGGPVGGGAGGQPGLGAGQAGGPLAQAGGGLGQVAGIQAQMGGGQGQMVNGAGGQPGQGQGAVGSGLGQVGGVGGPVGGSAGGQPGIGQGQVGGGHGQVANGVSGPGIGQGQVGGGHGQVANGVSGPGIGQGQVGGGLGQVANGVSGPGTGQGQVGGGLGQAVGGPNQVVNGPNQVVNGAGQVVNGAGGPPGPGPGTAGGSVGGQAGQTGQGLPGSGVHGGPGNGTGSPGSGQSSTSFVLPDPSQI